VAKSHAVAQHLPFLRRYARALTGSQQSGDHYVAATLEAVLEDDKVLDGSAGPRIELYRLFTRIWNSLDVNGIAERTASSGQLPVEQRLSRITPKPRQAFLLIALEGFSEEDAARVLDTDVRDRRRDRHRRSDHRGRIVHRHGS
jgi:DNA-directed RNA polymerase specialized sigma24 family protein